MADPAKKTAPEELIDDESLDSEAIVNDSLGTVDLADSTGTDEDKETGDAKTKNKDTGLED